MPKLVWTLEQHEDALGLPIVLMVAFDHTTQQYMSLRLRDLPPGCMLAVLAWLNARLP